MWLHDMERKDLNGFQTMRSEHKVQMNTKRTNDTQRRDSGIHSFLGKTCYCSKSLQMTRQNVKISSNQNGFEETILKLFQANVQKCVV